jgi:hydrogenase maturation protein HypF
VDRGRARFTGRGGLSGPLPQLRGRLRIRVRGRVQGVGYRPFVYALAQRYALTGFVLNDGGGVLIEAQGAAIEDFLVALAAAAPPLARIEAIEPSAIAEVAAESAFEIRSSTHDDSIATEIGPDAGICADCRAELFDPANRRYRYPFITCTHCGPRYTITRRLPYDRPQTSMADFALCDACTRDYTDPTDRRFHAETTACADCGPRLSHSPREIAARIRDGAIVALKGIGGYHLVCDARNESAVTRLRTRKNREAKPLAVMVANLASAQRVARVDTATGTLLGRRECPIVVLDALFGNGIAASVSQDLDSIGLMLPYTPVHWLLLHALLGEPAGTGWFDAGNDIALVMTSANPYGEALVFDDAEAQQRLAPIADVIVAHDRAIVVRCDDSVLRLIDGAPAFIRRARGYVPEPIDLRCDYPPLLAVGSYLKNTICLTRGREAFVSQHIGDLDNASSRRFFAETIAHLTHVVGVEPEAVVHDLHPDFPNTHYALASGLPTIAVQHHHAHVAAVLAEHHRAAPALGLALDGYGYGSDGGAWGGELFRLEGARIERIGHLAPLAQPGGERCARETWRCAAAVLHALGRSEAIGERFASEASAAGVRQLLDKGLAAQTSSAGRWFDAACGLLGIHWHSQYEGQAPMVLESLVREPVVVPGSWRIDGPILDLLPLFAFLIGVDARTGAECFHGSLIAALADWIGHAAAESGLRTVALGGGCFLNRVLSEGLAAALRQRGLEPLLPCQLPPNDGAISLGQAAIAAALR